MAQQFLPQLNEGQRAHLKGLLENEPEDWFLDLNGGRLPAEQLFSLSPWSYETSSGIRKKLLNRFINLDTGEAFFSVAETYGGQTFSRIPCEMGRSAWSRNP